MNEIYTAVYNKATSTSSFNTAIGGRYYTEKAPQEATYPYCVGHLITASDDSTFTERLDSIIFQFNIYDSTPDSIVTLGTIYTYLRTLFDDVALTVSGFRHYKMAWSLARPFWNSDEEIWQYVVEYEIEIQKT